MAVDPACQVWWGPFESGPLKPYSQTQCLTVAYVQLYALTTQSTECQQHRMHLKTYIHTRMCVYMCVHVHAYVYRSLHLYLFIYVNQNICRCILYMHTYVHIHICIHTHIHTYIHIYIYIHVCIYKNTYVRLCAVASWNRTPPPTTATY